MGHWTLDFIWGKQQVSVVFCSDSDWTGSMDERKSTTGYVFSFIFNFTQPLQGLFNAQILCIRKVDLEIISVFILCFQVRYCFQVFTFLILLQCGRLIREVQEQPRDRMIIERGQRKNM